MTTSPPGGRLPIRVAAALLAAATLFAGSAPAAADPSAGPSAMPSVGSSSADGPVQTVAPDQQEATGTAVREAGHVDIGPRYRDGRWSVGIHDDSQVPALWRRPADTVLRIRDTARQQVPADTTYAFLGEKPGTDVHIVPQTQQQDVVWIGWNTQDPGVLKAISRGVTMTLRGVQGPGRFTVYLQSGNLGAPQVLWNSTAAYPQPLWVETNTHTHANWVFGRPGVYLIALDVSADLADGTTATGSAILRFAVGDATSTDDALTGTFTAPLAAVSAAAARPADPATPAGGSAWLTLVLVAAAVLVVALLIAVALRGAAVRRRAERQRVADQQVNA